MATYLLKKSYQLKDLKQIEFQDLWGDHGIFTTMWIFGKPAKILFFDNHLENLILSLKKYRIKKKSLKSDILQIDYKSQSWDEFSDVNFDLVITVCDNAAGESCPVYLGGAPKVHWGVEDPAKFKGSEEEIENEFQRIFKILEKRTHAMVEKYNNTKKFQIEELNLIGSLI